MLPNLVLALTGPNLQEAPRTSENLLEQSCRHDTEASFTERLQKFLQFGKALSPSDTQLCRQDKIGDLKGRKKSVSMFHTSSDNEFMLVSG